MPPTRPTDIVPLATQATLLQPQEPSATGARVAAVLVQALSLYAVLASQATA